MTTVDDVEGLFLTLQPFLNTFGAFIQIYPWDPGRWVLFMCDLVLNYYMSKIAIKQTNF